MGRRGGWRRRRHRRSGAPARFVPGSLSSIVVLDEHDEAFHERGSRHGSPATSPSSGPAGPRIPCLLVSPCPSLAAVEIANGRVAAVSRVARTGRLAVRRDRRSQRRGTVEDVARARPRWPRHCVTPSVESSASSTPPGDRDGSACRACRETDLVRACVPPRSASRNREFCSAPGAARHGRGCARAAVRRDSRNLRPGVSRLREELEAAAGRTVVEVTSALSADEIPAEAGVYVGTEAVLHRVRTADVVAFLDFDSELLAPRYRAAEQAMALLVRAARLVGPRSGRRPRADPVPLAGHEVLDAAAHAAPERPPGPERERRSLLRFPPFGALATVTGHGADEFVASLPAGIERAGPAEGRWMLRSSRRRHARRRPPGGRPSPRKPPSYRSRPPTPLTQTQNRFSGRLDHVTGVGGQRTAGRGGYDGAERFTRSSR